MQVTHVQDHVTHAVIGGGKTASFGISDSAEFFNILSNTLYSDKIGAVGREILCNAWDILIETGRTHLPVVVTLKDGVLTIRDHGTGIARDMMVERYCVYGGGSTKTLDGRQTGGFSLGCKAPFAYVDHFEVTSFHAGLKTIYRLSKSSGEVSGKPGLTEIVSMPTDEHGLQVKLDVKPQDTGRFLEVLQRIACIGEMNVTINGNAVRTLPFSKAQEGFLVAYEPVTVQNTSSRIFIRYGNVAYPVEIHDSYSKVYNEALQFLGDLGKRDSYGSVRGNTRLVLLAEPNTISVTPSRESLSMTDLTVETLGSLLTQFNMSRLQKMEAEALKRARERTDTVWADMAPATLLNSEKTLFSRFTQRSQAPAHEGPLLSFEDASKVYVANHYPKFTNFWRNDVEMRLRSLIEGGFGGKVNRGKIQSFLAEFLADSKRAKDLNSTWFHRRLVAPLIIAMKAQGGLSHERLVVYANFEQRRISGKRYRYSEGPVFTEASKFSKDTLDDYLPFLRNMIILAYNRVAIEERAPHHPAFQHHFGQVKNSLVYLVQRNDAKAEAAREFFRSQGLYVVDLTKPFFGETVEAVEPNIDTIREYKPRKKGIPVLKCLLPEGRTVISTDLAQEDEAERIEKPEFIIKFTGRNNCDRIGDFSYSVSTDIVTLFGSQGGIVVNQSQEDKYLALGSRQFIPWVLPKLMDELRQNTRIHHHLTVRAWHLSEGGLRGELNFDQREVLKLIQKDPVLATYFDVADELTDQDHRYMRIWDTVGYSQRYNDAVKDFTKFLESFKPSQQLKTLVYQVRDSKLLDLVNTSGVERAFTPRKLSETTLQQQAKARDLIIWALKGQ